MQAPRQSVLCKLATWPYITTCLCTARPTNKACALLTPNDM